jgi:hypothetical protein
MARKRPRRRVVYVRFDSVPESERKLDQSDYVIILCLALLVLGCLIGLFHWIKDGLAGNGWT